MHNAPAAVCYVHNFEYSRSLSFCRSCVFVEHAAKVNEHSCLAIWLTVSTNAICYETHCKWQIDNACNHFVFGQDGEASHRACNIAWPKSTASARWHSTSFWMASNTSEPKPVDCNILIESLRVSRRRHRAIVSVGVSELSCILELFFADPGTKILSRYSSSTETATGDSTWFREEFYLSARQCICTSRAWNWYGGSASRNTRLHFSRFVASKQSRCQSSWLQDPGCHAASRVYQRKIHTINELKQRLIEVWCGFEQSTVDMAIDQWYRRLRALFVWRQDTSNIAFELTVCLDFINLLSASLLCFV